jgi:hypothetical protein
VKGRTLAAAIMVVGLLVLFLGPLVLAVLPTQTYWSDADQAEFQKASTEAHAAAFGGAHDESQPHAHEPPTDSAGTALRDATLAEFERHNAKLKTAQSTRKWLALGCRVLGACIVLTGIGLYFRARPAE